MLSYSQLNINNHLFNLQTLKFGNRGMLPQLLSFPRDNISECWRIPSGNASISRSIRPGLTAHALSCHSLLMELYGSVRRDEGLPFIQEGCSAGNEHLGESSKICSERHKCKWILPWERCLPSWGFSRERASGSDHRQDLLVLVCKSGISLACEAEHWKPLPQQCVEKFTAPEVLCPKSRQRSPGGLFEQRERPRGISHGGLLNCWGMQAPFLSWFPSCITLFLPPSGWGTQKVQTSQIAYSIPPSNMHPLFASLL